MKKIGISIVCLLVAAVVLPSIQKRNVSAVTLSLPAAPKTWVLTAMNPGNYVGASVSRPALASGQHVATCVAATMTFGTGWTGNAYPILVLRDGPPGTGNILMQWFIPLYSGSQNPYPLEICGLNVVGTANTPMTLEFTVGPLNVGNSNAPTQIVNLIGYDAL
jgi:hypothetical protein